MADAYDVTYALEDFVDELMRAREGDEDTDINYYRAKFIRTLDAFKHGDERL